LNNAPDHTDPPLLVKQWPLLESNHPDPSREYDNSSKYAIPWAGTFSPIPPVKKNPEPLESFGLS
jgi:hypothetical protein